MLTDMQYIKLLCASMIMIYHFLYNDYYSLNLRHAFQWWYSFCWHCHVQYMCNVYMVYKTRVSVFSLGSPTDYSVMLCKYILQHLLLCIIVNTYFLTDCFTATFFYYFIIYPDIYPVSFYSPTSLSQARNRRRECVIQSSHQ